MLRVALFEAEMQTPKRLATKMLCNDWTVPSRPWRSFNELELLTAPCGLSPKPLLVIHMYTLFQADIPVNRH
jgi:hypothetical protein